MRLGVHRFMKHMVFSGPRDVDSLGGSVGKLLNTQFVRTKGYLDLAKSRETKSPSLPGWVVRRAASKLGGW